MRSCKHAAEYAWRCNVVDVDVGQWWMKEKAKEEAKASKFGAKEVGYSEGEASCSASVVRLIKVRLSCAQRLCQLRQLAPPPLRPVCEGLVGSVLAVLSYFIVHEMCFMSDHMSASGMRGGRHDNRKSWRSCLSSFPCKAAFVYGPCRAWKTPTVAQRLY